MSAIEVLMVSDDQENHLPGTVDDKQENISKVDRFRKAILEDLDNFQKQRGVENPVDNLLKKLEQQKGAMSDQEYKEARGLIVDINQIQSRNARHIDRVWELLQRHEESL